MRIPKPGPMLLGLTTAAALAAVPATASASAHWSPVVGHVYVNDNTAGTNTIGAFDRHADGSLTREAGSPFAAGGAGTGAGLASQGALQISPDGRFLIAADAGSNQISVLRISATVHSGWSAMAWCPPVASCRSAWPSTAIWCTSRTPVTPAVTTPGSGCAAAVALRRSPARLPRCPVVLSPATCCSTAMAASSPGPASASSMIDSFTVGRDGRLTAAPGSPFPAQGLGPFGSEFRPTNPDQLFVSNAHNTATDSGTVSAFRDSGNGVLSSIGSSPFADQQMAPCWVEITHNGQFLFTVNTASGTISRYSITPGGTLTLLGSTPVRASGGVGAVNARLSPGGRYLYVDESKLGAVGAFTVHGGNLTELAGSPTSLPAGATPAGIVVTG